jgi:hypothetical protein
VLGRTSLHVHHSGAAQAGLIYSEVFANDSFAVAQPDGPGIRQEVLTVGINWTQTSARPVMPEGRTAQTDAHRALVGLLAVRPGSFAQVCSPNVSETSGVRATGGFSQSEQPRSIDFSVRVQLINGAAYGTTGGSAAKGSQKPELLAPAAVKASGVPPRSRPV